MSITVMTGGTSGFGSIAAERLAEADTRLILGSRRAVSGREAIPLELADLGSVRAFAASVRERLGGVPIDALVLNGGVIRPDAAGRTVDGFETSFAVNHLAHYLLVRLLLPDLAEGARVVLTTSGTHDPATGAGLTPPRHADARLLAHPDRDPDLDARPGKAGQHAYTASKLCVILTAASLSARPEIGERGIGVIAYCPGQVFGTGLAGTLPFPMPIIWSILGSPALGWPLRRLNRYLNTAKAAGNTLAALSLGRARPPAGRLYAALRGGRLTWPEPSHLAQRDDLASKLWADSAQLGDLPV